jgi:hypothetical protein
MLLQLVTNQHLPYKAKASYQSPTSILSIAPSKAPEVMGYRLVRLQVLKYMLVMAVPEAAAVEFQRRPTAHQVLAVTVALVGAVVEFEILNKVASEVMAVLVVAGVARTLMPPLVFYLLVKAAPLVVAEAVVVIVVELAMATAAPVVWVV